MRECEDDECGDEGRSSKEGRMDGCIPASGLTGYIHASGLEGYIHASGWNNAFMPQAPIYSVPRHLLHHVTSDNASRAQMPSASHANMARDNILPHKCPDYHGTCKVAKTQMAWAEREAPCFFPARQLLHY